VKKETKPTRGASRKTTTGNEPLGRAARVLVAIGGRLARRRGKESDT
jgi:hypothetical protein